MSRANLGIASTGIKVITVETVVLPNVKNVQEALQVNIRTSGEASS